jgi:hypothetical protein
MCVQGKKIFIGMAHPKIITSYTNLDVLLKGNNINQSLIIERWDDILRVAGSLKLGWVIVFVRASFFTQNGYFSYILVHTDPAENPFSK